MAMRRNNAETATCDIAVVARRWRGGCRTREAEGSPPASVVSLAEAYYAEGSGLSGFVDLRVAAAATPGATVRANTRPDDAACDYLAGLRTVIVRLARDEAMRRQSFSSS